MRANSFQTKKQFKIFQPHSNVFCQAKLRLAESDDNFRYQCENIDTEFFLFFMIIFFILTFVSVWC